MSLQVWLPLAGNLKNKGLTKVTKTSGTEGYVAGKLGYCSDRKSLKFSLGSNLVSNLTTANKYSIAFWFSWDGTAGWVQYLGLDTTAKARGSWINVSTTDPTKATLQVAFKSSGVGVATIDKDVWYHACYLFEGSKVEFYLNGVLTTTVTSGLQTAQVTDGDFLTFGTNARLSDYRVYDHVLSVKEIRDLSKGLFFHAPLNEGYEIGKNLFLESSLRTGAKTVKFSDSSTVSTGICNSVTSITATPSGYHLVTPTTGNGNNGLLLANGLLSKYGLSIGDTITVSIEVKGTNIPADNTSSLPYFLVSRNYVPSTVSGNSGWYGTGAVTIKSVYASNLSYNKWTRLVITCTLPQPSGTQESTDPADQKLYIRAANNFGGDTWWRNLKIEKGDVATPYNNVIYTNKAGAGVDLKVSDYIKNDTTSPKYGNAVKFEENTRIWCTQIVPSDFDFPEFTAMSWVRLDGQPASGLSGLHAISFQYNKGFRMSLGKTNSFFWSYVNIINSEGTMTGSGFSWGSSSDIVLGKWYHMACTFQNGIMKAYLDGEYVKTLDKTGYGTKIRVRYPQVSIGSASFETNMESGNGAVSDVRMYATCLSDADIKGIYRDAANIDNLGGLWTSEFSEVPGTGFSVKTSGVSAEKFTEDSTISSTKAFLREVKANNINEF